MYHNILVPLNRTKFDEDAIDTAINLAKTYNGNITLIHVFEILPLLKKDREIEYKNIKDKSVTYLNPIKEKIERQKIPVQGGDKNRAAGTGYMQVY